MNSSSTAHSDDEEASGDFPILLDWEVDERARVAKRDRLIRRVIEEEFLGFARTHGTDTLYLVRFETDAFRIWDRIGLDYRSNVIRDRVERINRLSELALAKHERISPFIRSESFQSFISAARYDWTRGKITKRAEERRQRELIGTPSEEDLLWRKIR